MYRETVKQREKVILIGAGIMVAYAVYALFLSGPPQSIPGDPGKQLEAAQNFIMEISTLLAKNDTSEADTYVITRAAAEWEKEPFLVSVDAIEMGQTATQAEPEARVDPFLYTGYLQAGDKTLAVINGMEYETGEVLDPGGYTIRDISFTQVIIEKSDDKTTIMLPMAETDME